MAAGITLKLAILVVYVFLVLPSTSDGSLLLNIKDVNERSLGQKKMVVGSRPPKCVNKCLSCKPCIATLVITGRKKFVQETAGTQSRDQDEYYLLSWKCRCGDKIFQP